jgi:N-ethylmaleimide reductase
MLFEPFANPRLTLRNRIVMAPMTRSRATLNNTANALMAKYYSQRAAAGLIITEGTSPSPNGLGYPRIPGLFAAAHVSGWRTVTDAVHQAGGKIFVQLMHTGRVTSSENLPAGGQVVGPTSEVCPGQMFTDTAGMQPHATPRAMTVDDIAFAVREYSSACVYADDAGFDGVEIHAANGYLVEQFLNANVNTRTDEYGESMSGRNQFALEVAAACVAKIGGDRVGIRLSPYGVFNSTGPFTGINEQYVELAHGLSKLGVLYMHLLDHSAMGAPAVPQQIKQALRTAFSGLVIAAGGYDKASAEAALAAGQADMIAFGRPFIGNPDFVTRLQRDVAMTTPDSNTFYSPGAKGYTDYAANT